MIQCITSGHMPPMRAIRRWHECHLHQLQRVSYPHQPSHRQAKGPSELSPDNGPSRMMAKIVPIISPPAAAHRARMEPQSSGVQALNCIASSEWNRNQAEAPALRARHAATQIEPHKRRFTPRAAPRTDHRPASTASHRTTVPRLTHPLVWRNTHCPSP